MSRWGLTGSGVDKGESVLPHCRPAFCPVSVAENGQRGIEFSLRMEAKTLPHTELMSLVCHPESSKYSFKHFRVRFPKSPHPCSIVL